MASIEQGRIDPAVVADLYAAHADELRAFLIGVLRDRDLAGEALQSTFRRTLEAGHSAQPETFKGWLFRVALNEALQLKRRRRQHDRSLRKLAWSSMSAGGSPGDELVRQEDAARLREALTRLPPEQRDVVEKRIYEEKTFAAIAEECGLPLGTVLTRMRLALRRLQQTLQNE